MTRNSAHRRTLSGVDAACCRASRSSISRSAATSFTTSCSRRRIHSRPFLMLVYVVVVGILSILVHPTVSLPLSTLIADTRIRSVATPASAADGFSLLYSRYGVDNSSVNSVDPDTMNATPLVQNLVFGATCLSNRTQPFSRTFPITPRGLSVFVNQTTRTATTFIGDSAPSARVFRVTSAFPVTQSSPPMIYDTVVGGAGCNTTIYPVQLADGGAATAQALGFNFLAVDPRDGTLYFTQANAVFVLSKDGTSVSYYFGNESEPGDRSSEPYTEISRRDARTRSPAQVFIDPVDGVMYVAEQGMGTVRSINMATSVARVELGFFETYTWPPADCSVVPCAASNVTLVSVIAVALYRSISSQRWLFVGDMTAAVIYRMVLETREVTTVAGSLLLSGASDGEVGISRLRVINAFAVAPSTLYIADGALRKLDLLDRPTPSPPIVPPTVVTATTTTTVVSTLVVGFVNPTAVTQVSRASVILQLTKCQRDFGAVPIAAHLLQFALGDDPDFQYFVGAVVGNAILCLGTLVLHFLLVALYATAFHKTWEESTASLKFPSLVALPLLFVMEPTVAISVSLVMYSSGGYLVMGIVGLVMCGGSFAGLSYYFLFLFDGQNDFEMLAKQHSGLIARMIRPVGEWQQTALTQRMGMFFEDYLPSCWWFVMIELSMCVLSGILEGIRPDEQTNCLILIGLATVLYTAFVAALVYYKPYTVRLTFFLRLTIAGMQMISTYLSVAYIKTGNVRWEAAATSIALASLYVTLVDAAFGLLVLIRDTIQFFQDQKQASHSNGRLALSGQYSDNDSFSSNSSLAVPMLPNGGPMDREKSSSSEDMVPPPPPPEDDDDERAAKLSRHVQLRRELEGMMMDAPGSATATAVAVPPTVISNGSLASRTSPRQHLSFGSASMGDIPSPSTASATSPAAGANASWLFGPAAPMPFDPVAPAVSNGSMRSNASTSSSPVPPGASMRDSFASSRRDLEL